MDRARVENVLIKMGMPTGIKGFSYIVDAMEVFEEKGIRIRITADLYTAIARMNNTTASRVERNIRHALEISRSHEECHEIVDKYIGFTNCANADSLTMLYKRISEESRRGKAMGEISRPGDIDFELEVKKIVRRELAELFKELQREDEVSRT